MFSPILVILALCLSSLSSSFIPLVSSKSPRTSVETAIVTVIDPDLPTKTVTSTIQQPEFDVCFQTTTKIRTTTITKSTRPPTETTTSFLANGIIFTKTETATLYLKPARTTTSIEASYVTSMETVYKRHGRATETVTIDPSTCTGGGGGSGTATTTTITSTVTKIKVVSTTSTTKTITSTSIILSYSSPTNSTSVSQSLAPDLTVYQ